MNDDKSCHWRKVLLVIPIAPASFVDYCPKTEVFPEAMKDPVKPLFSSFLSAAELLMLWNTLTVHLRAGAANLTRGCC